MNSVIYRDWLVRYKTEKDKCYAEITSPNPDYFKPDLILSIPDMIWFELPYKDSFKNEMYVQKTIDRMIDSFLAMGGNNENSKNVNDDEYAY